ncbi:DNA-3-methyladenine glycosylase [Kibdelosporangium phytohabitans]|uniref:Putative 3-methyladenine DNA glycosylase n=1 Tax=Kibdelosporangium phytohabitans TaxID=860235 RepID=A0A0N9IH47_9PSEU|nr:DNA-3-methyladenine glycosylase [Kibdelosporangium phytohabitans]ALG14808.1 DNA-3-methyladenine glycosylase [Kibdelosporangium phytohabitans]
MTRDELAVDPVDASKILLGGILESHSPQGVVRVRLVEVEAYRGGDDPASHCYRGRTARNDVMFGPAGHLYVYFVYGMHFCANIVSLTDGVPGAVLLRAGEVVDGIELARTRRPSARKDAELAKGPARLTGVLGIDRVQNGVDLTDPDSPIRIYEGEPAGDIHSGPRVGVAVAMDVPWRFWVDSTAVSAYRRGGKRTRQLR